MPIDPSNYVVTGDATIQDVDLDVEPAVVNGEVVDEARAEELAAQALTALRARNLVPGGKSLTGDGSHSPRVSFRVPAGLADQLEQAAHDRGVTISRLARQALEDYLTQR